MKRKCLLLLAAVAATCYAVSLLATTWRSEVIKIVPPGQSDADGSVLFGCLEGVVSVQPRGRFGNSYLEYASILGIARKLNLQPVLPERIAGYLRSAFEGPLPPTVTEYLEGRIGADGQPCTPRLTEEIIYKTPLRWDSKRRQPISGRSGPVIITSRFLYEYFPTIIPDLRSTLLFHPELREHAQSLLRTLGEEVAAATGVSPKEVVYVGVHARRSDYHAFLAFEKNVTTFADEGYYVRALAFLREKLKTKAAGRGAKALAVAVVSDDMAWVQRTLIPASRLDAMTTTTLVFAAGSGREEDTAKDMALLAACNHTVMSYGTYGITAALLAGGHTVVYRANTVAMTFARKYPNFFILK